jgi:hypothetical protein
VDDLDIWFAAVNEHDEEQDQSSGHPNNLITLLAITLDEVVVPHYLIRIVEDFRCCLERDSMDPLIPWAFAGSHVNLVFISQYHIYVRNRIVAQLPTDHAKLYPA